jgi:hypothetical protein
MTSLGAINPVGSILRSDKYEPVWQGDPSRTSIEDRARLPQKLFLALQYCESQFRVGPLFKVVLDSVLSSSLGGHR